MAIAAAALPIKDTSTSAKAGQEQVLNVFSGLIALAIQSYLNQLLSKRMHFKETNTTWVYKTANLDRLLNSMKSFSRDNPRAQGDIDLWPQSCYSACLSLYYTLG